MTATGTNPIWGKLTSYASAFSNRLGHFADQTVVKTRLQLSARKLNTPPAAAVAASPLPGPIASSAAALSSSTTSIPKVAITPVNAVGTAVAIIKQEGVRGLYRGMSASYLGVSEGVIQWVLYEVSPYSVHTFLRLRRQ